MNEVVTNATGLWGKIQQGDISAFTVSDIIWAVGFLVLAVLAIKIGYKLAKVVFVLLAIALIIFYLISQGVIMI